LPPAGWANWGNDKKGAIDVMNGKHREFRGLAGRVWLGRSKPRDDDGLDKFSVAEPPVAVKAGNAALSTAAFRPAGANAAAALDREGPAGP